MRQSETRVEAENQRAAPGGGGASPEAATRRALSLLYRDNIERLRAYLNRMLKSEADADDVAQEAFLRLCRCDDFLAFNQPRAVLFKTAYRLALNRLRHRRGNALDRAEPFLDDDICGVAATAEDALVAREREGAFGRALDGLPPRCRQVIELRTVQELSYKEMSDTLGLSVSTLEKHLQKGKRVCAELLAEWRQDDGFMAPSAFAVAA